MGSNLPCTKTSNHFFLLDETIRFSDVKLIVLEMLSPELGGSTIRIKYDNCLSVLISICIQTNTTVRNPVTIYLLEETSRFSDVKLIVLEMLSPELGGSTISIKYDNCLSVLISICIQTNTTLEHRTFVYLLFHSTVTR